MADLMTDSPLGSRTPSPFSALSVLDAESVSVAGASSVSEARLPVVAPTASTTASSGFYRSDATFNPTVTPFTSTANADLTSRVARMAYRSVPPSASAAGGKMVTLFDAAIPKAPIPPYDGTVIHPPFKALPGGFAVPDGLMSYTIMHDHPTWYLDVEDYVTLDAPEGTMMGQRMDGPMMRVRYPRDLEPPRPKRQKELLLRCTFCPRTYAGVNAKSMWTRHVREKHRVVLSKAWVDSATSIKRTPAAKNITPAPHTAADEAPVIKPVKPPVAKAVPPPPPLVLTIPAPPPRGKPGPKPKVKTGPKPAPKPASKPAVKPGPKPASKTVKPVASPAKPKKDKERPTGQKIIIPARRAVAPPEPPVTPKVVYVASTTSPRDVPSSPTLRPTAVVAPVPAEPPELWVKSLSPPPPEGILPPRLRARQSLVISAEIREESSPSTQDGMDVDPTESFIAQSDDDMDMDLEDDEDEVEAIVQDTSADEDEVENEDDDPFSLSSLFSLSSRPHVISLAADDVTEDIEFLDLEAAPASDSEPSPLGLLKISSMNYLIDRALVVSPPPSPILPFERDFTPELGSRELHTRALEAPATVLQPMDSDDLIGLKVQNMDPALKARLWSHLGEQLGIQPSDVAGPGKRDEPARPPPTSPPSLVDHSMSVPPAHLDPDIAALITGFRQRTMTGFEMDLAAQAQAILGQVADQVVIPLQAMLTAQLKDAVLGSGMGGLMAHALAVQEEEGEVEFEWRRRVLEREMHVLGYELLEEQDEDEEMPLAPMNELSAVAG